MSVDAPVGPGGAESALVTSPAPQQQPVLAALGAWLRRHPGAAVVFAGAAVRVAVWAYQVVTVAPRVLAGRTPDDAYYFVVIARNLAAGRGPTFDGVDLTTGYQPLWQGVLAALAVVVPDSQLLQVALLVGAALAVFGYFALARVTGSVVALTPFGLAVGFAVASGPLAWERSVNGMRGAVVIAAMALVALAAQRWWAKPSAASMGLVGVAAGLLCLGRTTHIVTVVVIPLLLLWGLARTGRRPAVVATFGAWAAGVVAVCLPWFVWSWVTVGTAASSAGAVKTHWQQASTGSFPSGAGLTQTRLAATTELWRQVSGVAPFTYRWPSGPRELLQLAVLVVVAWGVLRALRRRPAAVVVVAPALAVVGRYGVELLWIPNLRSSWYTAPIFTLTGLAVAVAVSWLVRRSAQWAPADRIGAAPGWVRVVGQVAVGLVVVVAVGRQAVRIPPTWGEANWEAGEEIRSLPPEARIGSFDTGSLGYLRPGVVNLDGLVRGPDYVERVTSGRPLSEVVLGEDLDFLVGRLEPGDERLPACARRVWASSRDVPVGGSLEPVRIWTLAGCPTR